MNILAILNNTDITPYINWKTYKSESQDMYESWQDGNYIEHRVYTRTRLMVSFDVWLCGKDDMDTDAFIDLLNGAIQNHIISMVVYNQNTNSLEAIEGFYTMSPAEHKEMMNGKYFDVFHIEVTQR